MTLGTETVIERAFQERVRLRGARYTAWMRHLWAGDPAGPGQGLAITHGEVDRALAEPAARARAEEAFREEADWTQLEARLTQTDEETTSDPAFAQLTEAFALTPPEVDMLCLLLAAEADPSLARVYGYLQDDAQLCHATPWLAARLFDWPQSATIGPDSSLVRWRIALPAEGTHSPWSCIAPWTLDPHIASWVLHGPSLDPALASSVTLIRPADVAGLDCLYPEALAAMEHYLRAVSESGARETPGVELQIVGSAGAGKRTLAAQLASALGGRLVVADAATLMAQDVTLNVAIERGARVLRLARLFGATVYWDGAESVAPGVWKALPRNQIAIFGATAALPFGPNGVARRVFQLPSLSSGQRAALWHRFTSGSAPFPVSEWTMTPGEIAAAGRSAPDGPEAVAAASREILHHAPGELFTPLVCPYTWDDIVLTPEVRSHLEEIESHARLRSAVYEGWGFGKLFPLGRGLTAMFAGPSGTGKTMAAQILARALGVELYRVDLSGVVNKYIGETEKRLKQVFDACERTNVLLFFDEADALFGQRTQVKDAHDRFANIEIDYLLQRMEQFSGIAILATNRKNDIDKAFLRRLRFIVDFVQPGPAERLKLWQVSLIPTSRTGEELLDRMDWNLLAEKLTLTGAEIKSAALAAAFLARSAGTRIGMPHVLAAARREMTKQGSVLRPGEWEV